MAKDSKKQKQEPGRIESAIYIASNMVAVAEKRCEMEDSRFRSLSDTAAKVITSISIITVALIAMLGLILENRLYDLNAISPFLILIGICILASFISSLIVLWQKPYLIFGGGNTPLWKSFIEDGIGGSGYRSVWASAKYLVKGLTVHADSTHKRNNRLKKQLQCSLVFLIATVVLIAFMFYYCIATLLA